MIGNASRSVKFRQYESFQMEQMTNLEVLGDFTDKTLERQLANKQFGRLLVPTDFTKSDRSRTESMRLLHTTSCLRESQPTINVTRADSRWQRSCVQQTWLQVVYVAPCLEPSEYDIKQLGLLTYHQWSCGQFAWYEPLLI